MSPATRLQTLLLLGLLGASHSHAQDADYVFRNGRVYTVNTDQPRADAVAVRDEKIVFVGASADAEALIGEKTMVYDLAGRMLLPGFVDGHIHPVAGAFVTPGVDVQFDSIREILTTVKQYADANPSAEVVRGFGFRYALFPATGPTKDQLDEIIADRPVLLLAIDGHGGWANSMALEVAGITKDTPDPQPGFSHFQRDPETGVPTGYLVEVPAVMAVLQKLTPTTSEALTTELESILPRFASAGITSLFDAGIIAAPTEDGYAIYFDLEKRGKLPVRVVGSSYHNQPNVDPLPVIKDYRNRFQSKLVQCNVLKINVDGGDPQYTAAMLQSYADKPLFNGTPIFSPKQLNELVTAADAAGIDCHFHAFGDRAVRMALDAVEAATRANPPRDRRHALGHSMYTEDADVPRFGKLGAIAQMSIQWATPDSANLGLSVERLGRQVVHTRFIRARSILEAGGIVAFGTDWPVAGYYSTYKPLEAIEVALTREMLAGEGLASVMPPEAEKLTLEQAIRCATLNSAYQLRLDSRIGSIELGKLADLVVLEKDLFTVRPRDISEVGVLLTMMNGRVTHRAESFSPRRAPR